MSQAAAAIIGALLGALGGGLGTYVTYWRLDRHKQNVQLALTADGLLREYLAMCIDGSALSWNTSETRKARALLEESMRGALRLGDTKLEQRLGRAVSDLDEAERHIAVSRQEDARANDDAEQRYGQQLVEAAIEARNCAIDADTRAREVVEWARQTLDSYLAPPVLFGHKKPQSPAVVVSTDEAPTGSV